MVTSNPFEPHASRIAHVCRRLRDLHEDMTVLQAEVLFTVAADPRITQATLSERLGVSNSHASRVAAWLGEFGGRNVEPLNLVVVGLNPKDRRERLMDLSPKGRRVMTDLITTLTRSKGT